MISRILAVAAVATGCVVPLAAQEPAPAALVYLMGTDTLGIERFTRTSDRLTGEITMRGQPRVTYDVALVGGIIAGPLSMAISSPAVARAVITMQRDSAIVQISGSGGNRTQRIRSELGAAPFQNNSVAMMEPLIASARASGFHLPVPIFLATGGVTLPIRFTRITDDSLVFTLGPQTGSVIVDASGRLQRLHQPASRVDVVRVEGPQVAALALAKPDYSAPAGAPYSAASVDIATPAGHHLAGTLTLPIARTGRVPAVVTITGSGPQDRDEAISIVAGFRPFRQIADTLGRRGIAVLRMDDRGTGESGGTFASSTSLDFADDIRVAVRWLRARPEIDPSRILLVGHSEGGLIAPLVAADDAALAGIVLMAGPSQRGRTIIDYQMRQAVEADTSVRPALRDSVFAARMQQADTTAFREPWMKTFLEYDPLPTLARVRVPVLILQGETDRQVTAAQADTIKAQLLRTGNSAVELHRFADRNHLFLPDPDGAPAGYSRLPITQIGPEVLGPLVEWIVRQTGRRLSS